MDKEPYNEYLVVMPTGNCKGFNDIEGAKAYINMYYELRLDDVFHEDGFNDATEIGGDESVSAISSLLSHKEIREDARMSLERIAGKKTLEQLTAAMTLIDDDYKINIAQSLRRLGVEVKGFPCQKLVPTKETKVTPVGR